MRRFYPISLVLLALSAPAAASPKEDACVVEATGRLPAVQGLKVISSSARPNTSPIVTKVQFFDVFLNVEAAGRTINYQFLCKENGADDVMIVWRKVLDKP